MDVKNNIINVITVVFVTTTLFLIFQNGSPRKVVENVSPKIATSTFNVNDSYYSNNFSSSTLIKNPSSSVEKSRTLASSTKPKINNSDLLYKSSNSQVGNGLITVRGVIDLTNKERSLVFVPILEESKELDLSATVKANDLLAKQYFEHVSPDGKNVSDLAKDAGYDYERIGENLARGGFKSNAELMAAWMGSKTHKENILNSRYMDIGVGVAYGLYKGEMEYIVVQHFGRPRSTCPYIDESIKNKISDNQKLIADLLASLDLLKKQIDQKNAANEDSNLLVNQYNEGVDKYNLMYADGEQLINKYNDQVAAFNDCVKALE